MGAAHFWHTPNGPPVELRPCSCVSQLSCSHPMASQAEAVCAGAAARRAVGGGETLGQGQAPRAGRLWVPVELRPCTCDWSSISVTLRLYVQELLRAEQSMEAGLWDKGGNIMRAGCRGLSKLQAKEGSCDSLLEDLQALEARYTPSQPTQTTAHSNHHDAAKHLIHCNEQG